MKQTINPWGSGIITNYEHVFKEFGLEKFPDKFREKLKHRFFERGIISYSNEAKTQLLDVSEDLLIKYGTVSIQVAQAMAESVRIKSNVDIGISTTGIAGPTGGTNEKPVGLVYISISTSDETIVQKFQFSGDRLQNKVSICNAALQMLLNILS